MMRPVHKALSRRTTTTSYDKDNKISQIAIRPGCAQRPLRRSPQTRQRTTRSDALKKAANEELERLPAEPVKKGDSWERTTNANLGAGQIMRISTRYTYDGEIEKDGKKLDKIITKCSRPSSRSRPTRLCP